MVRIINNSNLCFLNSALQLLIMNENLCIDIIRQSKANEKNGVYTPSLINEIAKCIYIHYKEVDSAFNPKALKDFIDTETTMFLEPTQHDSHECLIYLLDILHNKLKRAYKMDTIETPKNKIEKQRNKEWKAFVENNWSPIIQEYYGQFIILSQCKECNHTKYSFEFFNDIGIEIHTYESDRLIETPKSIDDGIRDNFKDETVEMVECDGCHKKVSMLRQVSICSFPVCLLIRIKRFQYSNGNITKLNTKVDIPKVLLFNDIISKQNITYNLKSVINHYGSYGGGHYTTTSFYGNQWIEYNDEHSNPNEDFSNAYVLMYQLSVG